MFGVRRWSQLWLLIYFGLHLHALSAEEREILAKDPLAFRDALATRAGPERTGAACDRAVPRVPEVLPPDRQRRAPAFDQRRLRGVSQSFGVRRCRSRRDQPGV